MVGGEDDGVKKGRMKKEKKKNKKKEIEKMSDEGRKGMEKWKNGGVEG